MNKKSVSKKVSFIKNKNVLFLIGLFLLFCLGIIYSIFLYKNQYYPSGADIWGHLYKSNYMYEQIKEGNWYPLFTKDWYNGIAPYRYWAPVPYYLMAVIQWLANGDVFVAYCGFAGVSIIIGGFAWLMLGRRMNRPILGTAIGLLWFFMPENFRVYFGEGNLPRMVTAMLIPYFIFFIYQYLKTEKARNLIGITAVICIMTLSHTMISAMTGIAAFLYFCFYSYENHTIKKPARVIISMLLAYVVAGIWLVPALSGGLVGMDADSSSSVMASLMYKLTDSLNPTNRVIGIADTFYYGISILLVSVLGILLGKKKHRSGYYLAILILLMTTTAALPILSKLPLNQLLWMMRFATIAYGFFLLSFMEWATLKKKFVVLFLGFVVLDSIPFANVDKYFTDYSGEIKEGVSVLKDTTFQRTSIMDISLFGSYPSFQLSQGNKDTMYSFGWAWQGATTAPNIVKVNTALENERYAYMFDRCVELGDDTVLVRKNSVGKTGKTKKDLKEGAALAGYEVYEELDSSYIFKKTTPKTFGVITDYKGIAIGNYGSLVELYYPSFTTGDSAYLDDYTYEELAEYETIYLSGFDFHSRKKAEGLITKLSKNGVKVVIDMCHVPVDKKTNRMYFLDVYMQDITFEKRYPEMTYQGNKMATLDFDEKESTWNTGYIDGIDNETGTLQYSGKNLAFLGTKNNNENLTFVGINLMYHGMQTEDEAVLSLFSDLFGVRENQLPSRELVPISIKYEKNSITISSKEDNVNTTMAALDTFTYENKAKAKNNLLYVSKGKTEITIHYPMFYKGLTVSILGLLCCIFFFRKWRKKEEHK